MNQINRIAKKRWLLLCLAGALILGSVLILAFCIGDGASAVGGEVEAGRQNILVAGQDRATGLCDFLLLAGVDRASGKTTLLSLPRDTFAAYNDGSYCKLNGAMQALGGMEAFCTFLEESMGVTVDRYVRMDPDALRTAVDAIGGVEIVIPEDMEYRDPAAGLSIRLPAGKQVLDGEQAEHFVRFRSDYAWGDLGRIDAQKLFLTALLKTAKGKVTLPTLVRLVTAMPEHIETNLTVSEMLSLGKTAMGTPDESILFFTLPGKACTVAQTGASYYVLSAPSAAELMEDFFGGDASSFDPEEVFCHHKNSRFCEIYREYTPYEGASAARIEENGVQIDRIP